MCKKCYKYFYIYIYITVYYVRGVPGDGYDASVFVN